MKNILTLLFCFVFCIAHAQYNPLTAIPSNKPWGPAQAIPTDSRSMFFDGTNFLWRSYNTTAEVLTYLNLAKYRTGNFPIVVHTGGTLNGNGTYTGGINTLYWFKDGTADGNLVPYFSNIYTADGILTGNRGLNGGGFSESHTNLSSFSLAMSGGLNVQSANNYFGSAPGSASVGMTLNYTDAIKLPGGTTAQRPSGVLGLMRFNSTLGVYEIYNPNTTSWDAFGADTLNVSTDGTLGVRTAPRVGGNTLFFPTIKGTGGLGVTKLSDSTIQLDGSGISAGSVQIGNPVVGGTVTRALYVGTGSTLQQSPGFIYDSTNNRFGIGASPSVLAHFKAATSQMAELKLESQTAAQVSRMTFAANSLNWQATHEGLSGGGSGNNNFDFAFSGSSTPTLGLINGSNGGIVVNTATPVSSSVLTVGGTTKGVLWPKLTTTQQNAIASPASGLMVYNTDSLAYVYYDGTSWRKFAGAGGTVQTQFSIQGDGSSGNKIQLTNDQNSPGNSKYYGTGLLGVKGYFDAIFGPRYYRTIDYGLTPDGIESFVGSSNGTTTFTCSTCSFNSGTDVGKIILIDSVNTGNLDMLDTIASVTNATTVVLNHATVITKSGLHFVYGTDNTVAAQNAITAAWNGGGGRVLFPYGIILLNGPLQTSISGVNPNAQLYIPTADSSRDHKVCSIMLEGEVGPTWVANDPVNSIPFWPSLKGTVLYSTIDGSGSAAVVLGSKGPSGSFANINYNNLDVKNITIVTRINPGGNGPTVGGINAGFMATFNVENVLVTVNNTAWNEPLPTSDAPGIIMPFNNSETINTNFNTLVIGYRYGQVISEHVLMDQMQAALCYGGIVVLRNGHASGGGRIEPFWCTYPLYKPTITLYGQSAATSTIMFPFFDMEGVAVGKWYDATNLIYDPSNLLQGYVFYHTGNSAGPILGAANLTTNPAENIYSVQKPTQVDIQGGTSNDPLSITSNSTTNSRIRLFNGTATGQSAFYLNGENNNFGSYGGFIYGNSSNAVGNINGVSRANKLILLADGGSNLGMLISELQPQPIIVGTNNTEAFRVNPSGEFQNNNSSDLGAYKFQNTGDAIFNGGIVQTKTGNTFPYSKTIGATAANYWQFGFTPTALSFSKGFAIVVDTNNNTALGATVPPTTLPGYSGGGLVVTGGAFMIGSSFFRDVATVTNGTTSIGTSYCFISCDATSGNITINLPAASTVFGANEGIGYIFYRVDGTGNTITINRAGSDLINGATSFTLGAQYTTKQLQAISTSAWAQY